jgi:hypothetical protein
MAQWVYAGGMFEVAFACLAGSGAAAHQALLLAHSLRAFGGRWSSAPIMGLVPEGVAVDGEIERGLKAHDVRLVSYALDRALRMVPLAERAAGAARAEETVEATARLLAWLDSDCLVLREPTGLRIPPTAKIGCRPVDLRLIGSPWEEAPDAFWELIYTDCGVDRGAIFPVRTTVEGEAIRAYFNAGCLVVRPEAGLLRRWRESVVRLATGEFFQGLTGRQRLFFHQAVLAGTVLAGVRREEIAELPPHVNYPLHLHERIPPDRRPASLRELDTCRYERVFDLEDWARQVPVDEDLRSWLEARRELARSG